MLGPGINQILGVRAREGCQGSVLDAAGWEDGNRENAEVRMRPNTKLFVSTHLSFQQFYVLEVTILPTLQMRKMELREVKSLAQGHLARRQLNHDSNPSLSDPKACALNPV